MKALLVGGAVFWGILSVAAGQVALHRGAVNESYQQLCMSCHGPEGEGGMGGSLIDGVWKHGDTDAAIARVIRDGLPELGMTPYGSVMSEDEIRAMVVFLRELELRAGRRETDARTLRPGDVVESRHHAFRIEKIAERADDAFWSIHFRPDGVLLVSGFAGNLYLFRDGELSEPVAGIPEVARRSQAGMLDIVSHPGFEENGWIYLSYVERTGGDATRPIGATRIDRGRIRDGRWVDAETIYRAPLDQHRPVGRHHGCRLEFQDGYLYFAVGERGHPPNAQDLGNPYGKVHRLYDDGRVPEDNPFVGVEGAIPSIWSYGNRNVQGLAIDPATGELWATEHGPRGGDELNRIESGKNYGWPVVTHGIEYNGRPITDRTEAPGMESPVLHWTPSIAVCGMDFLPVGHAFPGWRGHLFTGGLSSQQLHRLELRDGAVVDEEILFRGIGPVRDVAAGPDGRIYLAISGSREDQGAIYRLSPVGSGE